MLVGSGEMKAQTFALLLTGTDAHHCQHLSVVLRTRIVDNLHVADVLTAQTFQFACIAHLPTVYIYKR